MREKIFKVMNHIYGAVLGISFFAGLLPLIPFIVAMIIGGETGEAIAVFLYKDYYPWVIAAASVAVLIGWISLYVGGKQGLTFGKKKKEKAAKKTAEESSQSENQNKD